MPRTCASNGPRVKSIRVCLPVSGSRRAEWRQTALLNSPRRRAAVASGWKDRCGGNWQGFIGVASDREVFQPERDDARIGSEVLCNLPLGAFKAHAACV